MDLRDKIGLWANDQLPSVYFEDVPFKALREKVLNLLIPICNHNDFETHLECKNRGKPCWLPNWGESEEEAIEWYCYEHMHGAGFCRGCHMFWAGVEDFEFGDGLCSNCRHDPDYDDDPWPDNELWHYEEEDEL